MTLYSLGLFLHVLGAIGLFVALGLEWPSLRSLRRAQSREALHPWFTLLGSLRRIAPASLATLLVTGFYLTSALRPGMSWVTVALLGLVLIGALGGGLTGRRMAAIHRRR